MLPFKDTLGIIQSQRISQQSMASSKHCFYSSRTKCCCIMWCMHATQSPFMLLETFPRQEKTSWWHPAQQHPSDVVWDDECTWPRRYDPNTIAAETYDWRLSTPNMEKRDAYFTRLQARIELVYQIQGIKVDLLAFPQDSGAKHCCIVDCPVSTALQQSRSNHKICPPGLYWLQQCLVIPSAKLLRTSESVKCWNMLTHPTCVQCCSARHPLLSWMPAVAHFQNTVPQPIPSAKTCHLAIPNLLLPSWTRFMAISGLPGRCHRFWLSFGFVF